MMRDSVTSMSPACPCTTSCMPPSPTNSGHGRCRHVLSPRPLLRALLSLQQCINFQNGVSISSGVLLMAGKNCLWFFILTRLKLSGCNEKGNWIRLLHYHTISSSPKKSLTTTTNSHGYISTSNMSLLARGWCRGPWRRSWAPGCHSRGQRTPTEILTTTTISNLDKPNERAILYIGKKHMNGTKPATIPCYRN